MWTKTRVLCGVTSTPKRLVSASAPCSRNLNLMQNDPLPQDWQKWRNLKTMQVAVHRAKTPFRPHTPTKYTHKPSKALGVDTCCFWIFSHQGHLVCNSQFHGKKIRCYAARSSAWGDCQSGRLWILLGSPSLSRKHPKTQARLYRTFLRMRGCRPTVLFLSTLKVFGMFCRVVTTPLAESMENDRLCEVLHAPAMLKPLLASSFPSGASRSEAKVTRTQSRWEQKTNSKPFNPNARYKTSVSIVKPLEEQSKPQQTYNDRKLKHHNTIQHQPFTPSNHF